MPPLSLSSLWLGLLLLSSAGCATSRTLRYDVGQPERPLEVARAACDRLGWTSRMADSSRLVVVDYPNGAVGAAPKDPLEVRFEDGALVVQEPVPPALRDDAAFEQGLPNAPGFLAAATRQIAAGSGTSPPPRRAPKSRLLLTLLDLALPTAGGLYAFSGDPFMAYAPLGSAGSSIAVRSLLDGAALGYGLLLLLSPAYAAGPGTFPMWVIPVGYLLLNRVLALITDLRVVEFQRGLWGSGLELSEPLRPLEGALPAPKADAASRAAP